MLATSDVLELSCTEPFGADRHQDADNSCALLHKRMQPSRMHVQSEQCVVTLFAKRGEASLRYCRSCVLRRHRQDDDGDENRIIPLMFLSVLECFGNF